jgi:hypothetical protein
MLLALIAGSMLSQTRATLDEAFFNRLVHARRKFGDDLTDPHRDVGYTDLGAETLGGAHGDVFYPLGSASERFVISHWEGETGGSLNFERREGAHTKLKWALPFYEYKKKHTVHGTISLSLQRMGFEISSKVRVTRQMKIDLARTSYFAGYYSHPMEGDHAYVLGPEGVIGDTTLLAESFLITSDEKALLAKLSHAKTDGKAPSLP